MGGAGGTRRCLSLVKAVVRVGAGAGASVCVCVCVYLYLCLKKKVMGQINGEREQDQVSKTKREGKGR